MRATEIIRDEGDFDETVDVLVVGTGGAGFSAAIHARQAGAEVLLLEKGTRIGGTTFKSHGWMWFPNNSLMRGLGRTDDRDDALRYMARLARPHRYDPEDPNLGLDRWEYELYAAFYDNAAETLDSLLALGLEVQHPEEFPDYHLLPENTAPRGRVVLPRKADGDMGFGDELIDQLTAIAERLGVEIRNRHRVTGLLLREGDRAVVGLTVETPEGVRRIRARRGVVFGSGGFGQSRELTENFLTGPVVGSCSAVTNTGDLLPMVSELGVPLRNMNMAWYVPCTLEKWLNRGDSQDFVSLFSPPGDSMIFVNKYGKRTLNEQNEYHGLTHGFWGWDPYAAEYPNLFQVMVWDQPVQDHVANVPNRADNPVTPPGEDDSHVIKGATLEELAVNVRARFESLRRHTGGFTLDDSFTDNLKKSVATYSEYACGGGDRDFHRGENPVEAFLQGHNFGAPRNPENPAMYPFSETGPFYATIIAPGTLDTKGGPRIDRRARVLGGDDQPVPGLYAAGNCVAMAGRAYWAAGGTLGPATTFGRLAGQTAAAEPVREIALVDAE
jgi:succinate dehydrogenase/fumarate reductase flavoprotein subunit